MPDGNDVLAMFTSPTHTRRAAAADLRPEKGVYRYSHVLPALQREAADRIEAVLAGAR
jgi:hypothetical protein